MKLPAFAPVPGRLPRTGLTVPLLPFIAGPAQAQTPVKLASNTGQTGLHATGSTLAEKQIDLAISGSGLPSCEVEIRSTGANGG